MHWTGCDTNTSAIHLLNLAQSKTKGKRADGGSASNTVQRSLLDCIFDYLDVNSLSSFSSSSAQCKQLAESYIEMHSSRHSTFSITDEFQAFDNTSTIHNVRHMFAPYVTHANIHLLRWNAADSRKAVNICRRLKKISLSGRDIFSYLYSLSGSFRHIVYNEFDMTNCHTICLILDHFPHMKILELKNAGPCNDYKDFKKDMEHGKLEKLIFNYRSKAQFKNLKMLFKCSSVQLIPIFLNDLDPKPHQTNQRKNKLNALFVL